MDSSEKQTQQGGGSGYGYNYGGYSASGYGYGYGDGGNSSGVQRSFQDYLLILRERVWYVVVVFLVVFSSSLVYTLSSPKIYQSAATVQIFRRDPNVVQVQQVMDNDIRSAEDLNTQIKILESVSIVQNVAQRLTGDDLRAFLAPYERTPADTAFVADLLYKNRKVVPQRLTLVVNVTYQHPDRFVAAKVANFFVDEYIDHNKKLRMDDSVKAYENLKQPAEEQRRKVDQIQQRLQEYKEKSGAISLDSRKDIVNETLKAINLEATKVAQLLNVADNRLNQVKERREKGLDLTELPFIASQPIIAQLLTRRAEQQIVIASLGKRYRKLHPEMIKTASSLDQTERELKKAIDTACAQVEAEHQAAVRQDEQVKADLAKQKEESINLERLALDYTKNERELKTNEALLQSLSSRSLETMLTGAISTQNARIVDRAAPAPESKPISPNIPLNLGLGVVGGLGLGLAFAFFVAFIDDRVKSSYDIEGVVGLPLIGIIPQIKRMEATDKAQIVLNNADRQVAEAFLTLHSSLRLKDESKNAKAILTTSTIPGEGKSFTTTNLALTFAAHGEKVIVIDCDLRKPNVHKSFKIENLRGLIDICAGKAKFEDVVVRGPHANLDILPAGGRAKNPTQILNSKAFELLISDLKKRYDRVFVDTPPLAAVSDALIILPLMDGSIFTIFFNKVRRKAAQFAAKRLLDANVPNFGAVLNGLNLAVSGYYYAQYYDKSYKDYYVVMAKQEETSPERD
ncbi:MAG: polysaccharide biosynthesis tyrosine autokinase [Verrucomicrobia bacterium]|nr:polysaccharide biosynthesis tyrosine autokinase [Verrucomicrobiota bacterium]